MTYKEGDVIYYLGRKGEAIVHHQSGSRLHLSAWRTNSGRNWQLTLDGVGQINTSIAELHDDPDRIFAEFVAWRLTNA